MIAGSKVAAIPLPLLFHRLQLQLYSLTPSFVAWVYMTLVLILSYPDETVKYHVIETSCTMHAASFIMLL